MGRQTLAIAVLAGSLAPSLLGCGAELGTDLPADSGLDGRVGPLIDAPIDARPCAGGDARATDPMTGACLVFFTGPAVYADAQTSCTSIGAKLAVLTSAQTNAAVLALVGLSDAFVGASDAAPATEGTFVWRGDVLDPVTGYTNWRAGEPNNGGVGSTIEEDCMIIEGARNGTWDDRPCAPPPVGAGAYAYVCQY